MSAMKKLQEEQQEEVNEESEGHHENWPLHYKIIQAKKNFGTIKKDAVNSFHKNSYTTLEELVGAVTGPLIDVGIIYYHRAFVDQGVSIVECVVTDGVETLKSQCPIVACQKMQEIGSALTYARRYTLAMALGLVADKEAEDDGNKAQATTYKPKPADYRIQTPGSTFQNIPLKTIAEEKPSYIHKFGDGERGPLVEEDHRAIKAYYQANKQTIDAAVGLMNREAA